MARIPDASDFARIWSGLAAKDRRRIVRSVNRGTKMQDRKEAALAVVLARRQQRFWRIAWMIAPVISLAVSAFVDTGTSLVQFIANALLGAAVLTGMSVYFMRRARRAETLNLDHATHGATRRSTLDDHADVGARLRDRLGRRKL
ncbi:MAG: hypothetical protein ACI970_001628 [Myxococcota bacterium]